MKSINEVEAYNVELGSLDEPLIVSTNKRRREFVDLIIGSETITVQASHLKRAVANAENTG